MSAAAVSHAPSGNQIGAAEGNSVSPDDALAPNLLQLGAWNIQGKSFEAAMQVCCDYGIDLDLLALQEVGGRSACPGLIQFWLRSHVTMWSW